jgi:hypothetical protein
VNQQSPADTALGALCLTGGGSARLDLEVIQTAFNKSMRVVFKGTPPQNVVVGLVYNNIQLEGSC